MSIPVANSHSNPVTSQGSVANVTGEQLFCFTEADPIKFNCIVSPEIHSTNSYNVTLTGLVVGVHTNVEVLVPGPSFASSTIEWQVLRSLISKDLNGILENVINHTLNISKVKTKGEEDEAGEDALSVSRFTVMISPISKVKDLTEYYTSYCKFKATPETERSSLAATLILEALSYDADANIVNFNTAKTDIIHNNTKLQEQLKCHQTTIKSLKEECDLHAAELEVHTNKVALSNNAIKQKQEELLQLKSQLKDLESKIDTIDDNIGDESFKSEELDKAIAEINTQINDAMNDEKGVSEKDIVRKRALLDTTADEVATLQTQLTDLQEEVKELKESDSASSEAGILALKDYHNKIVIAETDHALKRDLIEQTKKELDNAVARDKTVAYIQSLTEKVNAKSTNLKSLVEELEKLTKENADTDAADIALNNLIEDHKKKVHDLISKLDAVKADAAVANTTHQQLKEQLDEHTRKLNEKRAHHAQFSLEHEHSKKRLDEKNAKLAHLTSHYETLQANHNRNLEALKTITEHHEEQLRLKVQHENHIRKLCADIDELNAKSTTVTATKEKLDVSAKHLETATALAAEAHKQYEASKAKLEQIKESVQHTTENVAYSTSIATLHANLSSHVKKFKYLTAHINKHYL
jgi:chromosome segregation ATPase